MSLIIEKTIFPEQVGRKVFRHGTLRVDPLPKIRDAAQNGITAKDIVGSAVGNELGRCLEGEWAHFHDGTGSSEQGILLAQNFLGNKGDGTAAKDEENVFS